MNAPSLWVFLQGMPYSKGVVMWGLITAAGTVSVLIAFFFVANRRKDAFLHEALCFLILIPLITPKMHERYFFPADVFSLVLVFIDPRIWPVTLLINLGSLVSYLPFLFGKTIVPLTIIALIHLLLFALLVQLTLSSTDRAKDHNLISVQA
jgi:Gpi18-like mannosyltransferase